MNTLWSFGDSFSTPYGENPFKTSEEYIHFKGYEPPIFSKIIAEKLGMECVVNARGGLDNYSIFENLCNVSDEIIDGDIIIIGWSHINRFRVVQKNGEWAPILPFLRLNKFTEFNMDALDVYAVNRLDYEEKYSHEVNSWIKLINKSFSNNIVIHWSPFLKTKINVVKFKNLSTIKKETNNLIDDGHYGEIGHKDLSDIFLNIIYKKKNGDLI